MNQVKLEKMSSTIIEYLYHEECTLNEFAEIAQVIINTIKNKNKITIKSA
jgi:hypothetical protein